MTAKLDSPSSKPSGFDPKKLKIELNVSSWEGLVVTLYYDGDKIDSDSVSTSRLETFINNDSYDGF